MEEGTSYRTPAFRANGVLFVRLHQDGDALVVRSTFDEREELMAEAPDTYFITDHYLNYQWVLVRMANVPLDELRDLLHSAYLSARAAKPRGGPPRRPHWRRSR